MLTITFYAGIVIFLVLLNGFFVASEIAILRVHNHPYTPPASKRLQKTGVEANTFLSASQLGITFTSLSLGWLGGSALSDMFLPAWGTIGLPPWAIDSISLIIPFILMTFLHLILGEIIPKALANRKPEVVTQWTVKPLHLFYRLCKPIILIVHYVIRNIPRDSASDVIRQPEATRDEIKMMLAHSYKNGHINSEELNLLENVLQSANRIGREVMTPRVNIVCLYRTQTLEEGWRIAQQSGYTKFPLCGKDKDDIIGIVHTRDLYEARLKSEKITLESISRLEVLVPETMELTKIMRNLQQKQEQMAIVVDEYGGTAGLITSDDITDAIFGGKRDHGIPNQEKPDGIPIHPNSLIHQVNSRLHTAICAPDHHTIGEWLFSQLGRIPKKGDQIEKDGWIFVVTEVWNQQLSKLRVIPVTNRSDSNLITIHTAS